eukprot:SM000021S06500  [mRNA]  locus=s21:779406:787384:+ [translate_table: standard]
MGILFSGPAKTVARVGESAEAAKAIMAQMNVAANAISSAATHAEEVAYSAQVACTKIGDASNAIEKLANTTASLVGELGPRLSTTFDQASSTLGAVQESVNQITPQAASTLETVQTSVQDLTPTAQSALHSLSATSEAVGQNIPALMQSCQAAAVAAGVGAAALASTAHSLKTIAVNCTRMVATKEASLVFRASDRVSDRAGGFFKALKDDQHGVFIPATEDAYLMCCNNFTKGMQERHLARTPKDAIEKVKAMRKSGVLLKEKEVVYHRDVIVATYIIEMPKGMGRFIICGSTDLHGQPYIQLKGIICDLDQSGAPMGKVMNLAWQPQHVALEYCGQQLEAYVEVVDTDSGLGGAVCGPREKGPLLLHAPRWTSRSRARELSEVVAHLLLASRAPLNPQQLGKSREVADGEAQGGGGLHEQARGVTWVRAAGGASSGQPRHRGDGARAWEKRGRSVCNGSLSWALRDEGERPGRRRGGSAGLCCETGAPRCL